MRAALMRPAFDETGARRRRPPMVAPHAAEMNVTRGFWGRAVLVVVLGLAALVASQIRLDIAPGLLEQKYATPPSRFVEANGIRFHVRDRGTGPAIVLLHGQSETLFAWDAAAELLAARHRVISVDLPGHGLTGPDPQSRYSWAGLAASLDALTTTLGLTHFALAGNSLGGAIALEYALAYPQKLDALILLDSIGAPRDEPKPLIFEAESLPVIGPLVTLLTPQWLVRLSLQSTYGDPAKLTDADITTTAELVLRQGNRDAQRQIVSQMNDLAIPARIGEIDTPTLILWGSRDTWVLPKYADWFAARLPDATLHVLPGLGHMPMAEDPTTTVAAIETFLRLRWRE
jgi:pimeloyl-ACP methyl ester carboxylesterase